MRILLSMLLFGVIYCEGILVTPSVGSTTAGLMSDCDIPVDGDCINVFRFDESYVDELERQLPNDDKSLFKTRNKLSKLALYLRLYRRFVFWPDGRREGLKKFPDVPVPFHKSIWKHCAYHKNNRLNSTFEGCVDYIFEEIRKSLPKMFPDESSLDYNMAEHVQENAQNSFELSEENFLLYVDGTSFSFETSAQYLFCWLTMNRLSIFKDLYYCEYGPDEKYSKDSDGNLKYEGDKKYWRLTSLKDEYGFNRYPIYQCAQESFCPDPCCGMPRLSDCNTDCPKPTCTPDKDCTDAANPKCELKHEFNNDFVGIINNMWNRSCDCADRDHFFYDFDIGHCVDVNECLFVNCSKKYPGTRTHCVNTYGGYECTCPPGTYYEKESEKCVEWSMEELSKWFDDNWTD